MNTVIPGLIKIGKTGNDKFENRMRFLENNGWLEWKNSKGELIQKYRNKVE